MTQPGGASFGDDVGEMANETEVEVPVAGTSAPAEGVSERASDPTADTSGVDDWLEEGGPLEPSDLVEEPVAAALDELAERTADLQRLSAEYANYRKRVERERVLTAENATFKALGPVIDVLDTIDRAREHGELEDGFRAVAEQLKRAVEVSGLIRFGESGEAFDPNLHDALTHLGADPEVAVTTIKHVAKAGYRIGDRVVRPAQVVVVDPVEDAE